MKGRRIYSLSVMAVIGFYVLFSTGQGGQKEEFPELAKIALREVGHQLLLSLYDSTSVIPPVIDLSETEFKLSFQKELSFEPGNLVSLVKEVFQKSGLPEHYVVEVIQCDDEEVAYSYKMTTNKQTTIIPCAGRFLPKTCYVIQFNFAGDDRWASKETIAYTAAFSALILFAFLFAKSKVNPEKRPSSNENFERSNAEFTTIGSFEFYPEQNKLVKAAMEISLSRKECELLTIFVASPNQIIKRDELTKKVWEDNGVIVGRSLDTYISKLRKKLKPDESIKLSNVHGVGYKLEVDN